MVSVLCKCWSGLWVKKKVEVTRQSSQGILEPWEGVSLHGGTKSRKFDFQHLEEKA